MTEVYADVLVALNILFTYIFLVATRVICKVPTKKWGVAIASVIGGFSSLIIFVGEIHVLLSVTYRVVLAIVITTVAFLPGNLKVFLKVFFSFFGVSFLFAGVMYAIEITFNPQNVFFINGTVYFNMSITYLVGSILVIYGVFLVCNYFLQRNVSGNEIYDVKIYFRNTHTTIRGVVDTGNNLKCGITGRPVIVAELDSLNGLFTKEEVDFLKNGDFMNVPVSFETKIHLVPCKTVSGNKLLPAIIPRKVGFLKNKNFAETDFVAVAIINGTISSGEYNALLYKEITELNWRNNESEKTFS